MTVLAHPILAAIFVLAMAWVPASVLLLRGAHAGRCRHRLAAEALQSQLQVQLFRGARRDALTALPCRPAFLETLAARLAHGRPAALLVIDLDHFANVNVTHGETAGDEVLCAVADRLRTLAGTHGHPARLDGDTFALLLEEADALEDLDAACDRMLHILTAPYPAAGQLIDVRLGIGLARAPEHGDSAEMLLRAAHLALEHAQAQGGNRWCRAGADLALALRSSQKLRGQLRRAISQGQVIPWYQPIVRLADGSIESFEVLARWHHPEHGMLTPDQFIPLAEEMGLAAHLSMALLRQVSLDCVAWPETCRFAFNVSAGQVRELIGFLNTQPGEWQRRVDLSRLDVEITECALMMDRAMARELIDTLHEHGARAGLDNFGSGVSNFSFLRDMPFDSIKIGKVFVQTMLADPRAEACVLSMLWLGHGLGVEVVADGVEDEAAAEHLMDLGCKLAQGFFYARPVPAEEVAGLFTARSKPGGSGPDGRAAPRVPVAPAMMAAAQLA